MEAGRAREPRPAPTAPDASTLPGNRSQRPRPAVTKKLTVRDLQDTKGKRKLVLTTAFDYWTAKACEEAGVDVIITFAKNLEQLKGVMEQVRGGAPNTMIGAGLPLIEAYSSDAEALRLAGELSRNLTVDLIFSSGMVVERFGVLARQRFPCIGHVGYLPVQNTWFGGPRAVGKSWQEAVHVFDTVTAMATAGVVGIEMELLPRELAAEITKRLEVLTFSMGSGPDCDGQIVFSADLLGTNTGHIPRHASTYASLFDEATRALSQFRQDVTDGTYPAAKHAVRMPDEEYGRFLEEIARIDRGDVS
jgi:3-methyl-2-oxobutanoate hydroxymethyltransferase